MIKFILASASPRRREILENLGAEFTVIPANIDESVNEGEDAPSYALRMAVQKAIAVGKEVDDGVIVAADTIVAIDGQILGKPQNAEMAKKQLQTLSGREHIVITGIGILDKRTNRTISAIEQTIVYFQPLSIEEIEDYVATSEPLDKAGSYGIQGKGGLFIRRIEGDYFNVVGLPVHKLYSLFKEIDYDFFQQLK